MSPILGYESLRIYTLLPKLAIQEHLEEHNCPFALGVKADLYPF